VGCAPVEIQRRIRAPLPRRWRAARPPWPAGRSSLPGAGGRWAAGGPPASGWTPPRQDARGAPPSLEALRQVPQLGLPVLSIGRPGRSIPTRSRLAVQPVIRLAASVDIVARVPERRQRLRGVPPRCLSSPVERTLQGAPALCPAPGVRSRLPLGQLPARHGLCGFGLCSTPHRRSALHMVQALHRY